MATCFCGEEQDKSKESLRSESATSSGKKYAYCSSCGDRGVFLGYYCDPCDVWYGGRSALKQNPVSSGVTAHVCPSCDGLIRSGEELDRTQGPNR